MLHVLRVCLSLLSLILLAPAAVAGSSDPWLSIEKGWIWRVVDRTPQTLAGSWNLQGELQSGVTYRMSFDVTDIQGRVAVYLGDNQRAVIDQPGTYVYTFTANHRQRMVFQALEEQWGRVKLAANRIRVSVVSGSEPASGSRLRVAYSSDGNAHDADDWSASPLTLAMLADERAGFDLVHFDYNNHLGSSNDSSATTHANIVKDAIVRYGFDASRFFDDQRALWASVKNLAAAINASSADDRLYLICAGPMEVCWRGINAARNDRERFVTVITHSWWNDNHSDTAALAHTLGDIERDFDVQVVRIADQNATAFRSPVEDWVWLQQHGADGQWLYERITMGGRTSKPGDASDAGMAYYVLDGMRQDSESAAMWNVRALFND